MLATSFIKINVTQVMLEELVPHLIKIRHPKLAGEINTVKVINKVLSDSQSPNIFAYNQKQLNQQKIKFNQNHLFAVRKLVNQYLDQEANQLQHRISNSVVLISSRQREELLRKNKTHSFRETFKKSTRRHYVTAS